MTEIRLFSTPAHDCPYLQGETSVTQFVDPDLVPDVGLYTSLSQNGFRRSGEHIYRPVCPNCSACKPIRVVISKFQPSRSQKRCINKGQQFNYRVIPAQFSEAHYKLYEDYISERHSDGDMYPAEEDLYRRFLLSNWSRTRFLEIMDQDKLIACAVFDRLLDGMSAVYSYFDTQYEQYSLGKLAILLQIQYAKSQRLPYLYLGYQIDACQKMNYKTQYHPTEQYLDNSWQII